MSAGVKTAVLGATGYSGLELTRILLQHPRLAKPILLRRDHAACNAQRVTLAGSMTPAATRSSNFSVAAL